MNEITAYINGTQVRVNKGVTILNAAKDNNIDYIPTLCYDPRLEHFASCFVCAVEIEGMDKLLPACSAFLENNMRVYTNSDKVLKARKTALELLLSNHYADCVAPCQERCPAKVDVQGYIALVAEGKYSEAVRLIKETNPLPLVCGRICVRTCELSCRRNAIDEAVGIDYIKRYASDTDIENPWTPKVPAFTNKKIAIVGGGPAGLSAAYYLRLSGYAVTIFEQMPALGGMLRYGIPEYRLPKADLDREIAGIINLGVSVDLNKKLGSDFTIKSLKESGFDAIFLAIGAWKAKPMRLPDEFSTDGVLSGIEFLRKVQNGESPNFEGKTAVIVGGGNTAIDASRTAIRLNAKKVYIAYRRTRQEMPAHENEISAAEAEGVEIIYLAAPILIKSGNGSVKGLECLKMELGAPDASGRRSPIALPNSEYVIDCDYIISAIGQDVDSSGIHKDDGIHLSKWNTPTADEKLLQTSADYVFIGGDAYLGAATAIEAIAHGKIVANSIDEYLTKKKIDKKPERFLSKKENLQIPTEKDFPGEIKSKREIMPELDEKYRIKNHEEVELGLSESQAQAESFRCMECGCSDYFFCNLRKFSDLYGANQKQYGGEFSKYFEDKRHPFIALDSNKCIACGLCVRTCGENLKISALGFVDRGLKTTVKPALNKPLLETTCVACGNCIDVCPTGAIYEKKNYKKSGPYNRITLNSVCRFCGLGCAIQVENVSTKLNIDSDDIKFDDFIGGLYSVIGGKIDSVNDGYLCYKGRFGHRAQNSDKRLMKPLINGIKTEIGKSVKYAIELIKNTKESGKALQFFVSPKLSFEELYIINELAKRLDAKISSAEESINSLEVGAFNAKYGALFSTAKISDLDVSENIIIIGSADNGVLPLEYKIAKAEEKGAHILRLDSAQMNLQFSSLISTKKATTIVYNPDANPQGALELIIALEKTNPNIKSIILRNNANSLALQALGIFPALGEKLIGENSDCVISIGEDISRLNEFEEYKGKIIYCDYLRSKISEKEGVAIPISEPFATKGAFVSCDNRISYAKKAVKASAIPTLFSTANAISYALFPSEKAFSFDQITGLLGSILETARTIERKIEPEISAKKIEEITIIRIDSSEIFLEEEIEKRLK